MRDKLIPLRLNEVLDDEKSFRSLCFIRVEKKHRSPFIPRIDIVNSDIRKGQTGTDSAGEITGRT